MGHSEIITRVIQAMWSWSLWLFALVCGALFIPAHLVIVAVMARSMEAGLAMATASPASGPDVDAVISMMRAMPWMALASLLAGVLAIPVYVLLESGVAIHTRAFLSGRRATYRDLMSAIKAVYLRALKTYAILYAPWLAIYALVSLVAGLAAEEFINGLIARGDVTGVLLWTITIGVLAIVLVCGVLVAFLAGIFAVRAAVLDGSQPLPAIRWSLGVVRKTSGRIAMMYGAIYLVQMVFSMLVSLVVSPMLVVGLSVAMVGMMAPLSSPEQAAATIPQAMTWFTVPVYLSSAVMTAPMLVFTMAAWTVFYERLLGRPLAVTAGPAPEVAHA